MKPPPPPCPVTETVGGYILRCVMPAGHGGEHWAAELEDVVEPEEAS